MEYANPFTLHLFARNADKHRGSEDEMQILTLHPPSSFCYFQSKRLRIYTIVAFSFVRTFAP